MTTSRHEVLYAPIPGDPNHPNVVVLLPVYYSRRRLLLHRLYNALLVCAVLLSVSAAVFLLYPSDPTVQVVAVRLNNFDLRTSRPISLDLSLDLTIKVRNRDFFSFTYTSLTASVGYRGRPLGFVNSTGGYLKARGSSYINATLNLNGIEILHDVFYLLEDLARGSIPFDTESDVQGRLGLFVLEIPLEARVSCEVFVNTKNQTIVHQDCYPMRKMQKSDHPNRVVLEVDAWYSQQLIKVSQSIDKESACGCE